MNDDIYEMIKYFGERKKNSLCMHFQENVSSQVPKFHEEFAIMDV